MGSSEPLDAPCPKSFDMHESDIVVIDGDYQQTHSPCAGTRVAPSCGGTTKGYVAGSADGTKKMKMSVLGEEDVVHIFFMTKAVKAVEVSITNASPPDVHPALYSSVMDARGFNPEALMVALSHLFDNMTQGNGFVQMAVDIR
jgi:hypothetical protein